MTHLFTYGTLMHPKIWDRLIRNTYETKPFKIFGYARKALRNRVYPALVIDPSASVRGLLYLNVNAEDLKAIDDFEGDEYKRIDLELGISGEGASINTYLYTATTINITDLDWDYETFLSEQIVTFENSFQGWNTI